MKKVTTVSIGIPAYNEGKNIQHLLKALIAQKETDIRITEIFVISDGSSDDTKEKVKAIKDKRIIFKDDGKRLGKSARLDYIFRTFTGDVLVLADADIYIDDTLLIANTIKKAKLQKSGLAGVNALPLPAETKFEQIIETGVFIMKDIAKSWNNANNYLSFKGCFMVLDGILARSIHMPARIVNNDPFIYFSAIEMRYAPIYIDSSKMYYRSPMTLADHIKQSSRYKGSREELEKYFQLDWDKQYTMPVAIVLSSILKSLVSRPLTFFPYIAVNIYSQIKRQTKLKSTWSIANSTKGKISV